MCWARLATGVACFRSEVPVCDISPEVSRWALCSLLQRTRHPEQGWHRALVPSLGGFTAGESATPRVPATQERVRPAATGQGGPCTPCHQPPGGLGPTEDHLVARPKGSQDLQGPFAFSETNIRAVISTALFLAS